jgi:hypothetical protein
MGNGEETQPGTIIGGQALVVIVSMYHVALKALSINRGSGVESHLVDIHTSTRPNFVHAVKSWTARKTASGL